MEQNEIKQKLLDECLAYIKYHQNVDPVRVQEMVKDAFRAGYEQAILNYVVPYKGTHK